MISKDVTVEASPITVADGDTIATERHVESVVQVSDGGRCPSSVRT
ncbi:hypothetical protein ACWD4J_07625 [Streptomyces sp. NPDC002577]